MMRTRFARLGADEKGVALVEFALLAPVLALLCVGAIDFGLAFASQQQLSAAVESGAQYAFLSSASLQPSSVQAVVQSATSLPQVAASVTYDGSACYCPAGAPIALTAQTCGQPCADGSLPGKYLSISAKYVYTPIFPTYALIADPTLTQTVTVRLR